MPQLTRITRDPDVMGGKPCIRGMRVTVGTVVGSIGYPFSTPLAIESLTPLSIDGMKRFGMASPIVVSSKL